MRYALYLLLLIVVINSIILDKSLNVLSAKELKRRARSGRDKRSASIYKMAAYGKSLSILLWVKGSLAAAIFFVLVLNSSWLAAFVFLAVLAWAVRAWQPTNTKSWVWPWAAAVAPLVAWVMAYLQPVLGRLQRAGPVPSDAHTGLYEREDLLALIKTQNNQLENRIPEPELKMAFGALSFGDKTVGSVMTPIKKVKLVSANEQVGPILMDELYESGQTRFPVVKPGMAKLANPEVIGILHLRDLISSEQKGQVNDLTQNNVFYINEAQSLRQALPVFLKTHQHLLIVVNNFEEIAGVLNIEDVLEQIIGEKLTDEFERYDDLRAVAGLETAKDQEQHQKQEANDTKQAAKDGNIASKPE